MHKTIRKLFSDEVCDKIENMRILLVGAGGIGSEFLKNIITIGCKNIDIIDIDTIDITNLNRQFLFKKKDVKEYKSHVAKERALEHKKDLNINAYTFDVCTMKSSDIRKYDYVINALDNIKARKYVNKLCIMEKKVLIEAGSTGYNGQVYPIYYNQTKCYSCEEKPKNKTYAICTIRQTPSLPEHCVAWGRLIFETFFCKNDNETLIDIKNHIEEESKKRNMDKKEIIIFIFNYLFNDTIKELIYLKKDYTTIPIPIHFECDENIIDLFEYENEHKKNEKNIDKLNDNNKNNMVDNKYYSNNFNCEETNREKDDNVLMLSSQNIWDKKKCIQMYIKTFLKLYKYLNINKKEQQYLIFDKDDDECINFITSISNIRMLNFSINQKSKFDIQSIAGNIIPAISSTNAIVASLQAFQLIHVIEYFETLKKKNKKKINSNKKKNSNNSNNNNNNNNNNNYENNASYCDEEEYKTDLFNIRNSKAKHVWVKSIVNGNKIFSRGNLVNAEPLEIPNPNCYICQQPTIHIYIKNFDKMTLYNFVKDICMNELSFLYPFLDKDDRNIFDYDLFQENDDDYIQNLYASLNYWNIKHDEILLLTDFQNNNDQLEMHLKEDPSLETEYFIQQKKVPSKKRNITYMHGEGNMDTESVKKKKHILSDEHKETNDEKQPTKKRKQDSIKVEEIIIDDEESDNQNVVLID
ncbi:SUMO-activating enzyme subunit 2, putative [Plasmodium reichenowi]|uniref:SUMO-activating enzyme subunit n=1 Tax=Plasmodium reichenowi TaxID=5854 RepID=A0A060RW27_PLARE|nr:SUMO-activating enzyme subunit 2, putative [Plasmodium reichenowi]